MGLNAKLLDWKKSADIDMWSVTHKNWLLKVQENENGDWQWEAINWSNGNRAIHHITGEKPTRDEAMDVAYKWAVGWRPR